MDGCREQVGGGFTIVQLDHEDVVLVGKGMVPLVVIFWASEAETSSVDVGVARQTLGRSMVPTAGAEDS